MSGTVPFGTLGTSGSWRFTTIHVYIVVMTEVGINHTYREVKVILGEEICQLQWFKKLLVNAVQEASKVALWELLT